MSKLTICLALLSCVCLFTTPSQSAIAQQAATPEAAPEPAPRELLVPFSDLHLLLGNETRRVFMTREELAKLKADAKQAPDEALPQQVALLSAEYDAKLESGRAVLVGKLQVEVLGDGLHALPLNISGVGIRSAQLDDKPAALVGADNGIIQLILQGRGVHKLHLEMVLPIATAAAQQSLSWTVPVPPATRFHLSVPGNVEMKSGAALLNRRVDDSAGVTHFDLLPGQGAMNLVMSLNNKRLRDETTILARGVLISEITQGYQRLHANLSMNVLHGAADEFRIGVPKEYEITQVTSPLLTKWSVEESTEATSGQVLVIKLRELVNDRTTIQLRADRLKPELGSWQMPQLQPLKVAGFASVVGILLEDQLAGHTIDSAQLIPIDNQILTAALPESVLAQEPGAPRIRPLATFYAAQTDYTLKTSFTVEPAELKVTTNLLFTLNDRGLECSGAFSLLPSSEKLFAFDFMLPPNWTVDAVTLADGRPLNFERHESTTGWRVRVQLPGGLAPGTNQSVSFHANNTPVGWLDAWNEQIVPLPNISIAKTPQVHETGALAVRSFDDLKLQPESLSGLIVVSDSEKSKYGCPEVPLNFAWRYTEEPWQGSLKVTRATPRMTGRALSFYRVNHDALTTHYELFFDVEQASAQRVSFSLPESTPAEITVRGLGDAVVKETTSQVVEGRRQWTIQLADKKIGRIKLAVDFTQPLTAAQLANLTLPEVRTENVAYQSGLVAVEGDAELDINVPQHPRTVDIGELIDAEYQVGSRLLGVYSYVGNQGVVTIQGQRRELHGLPTTIVERAELVSLIGVGGNSQTAARFLLRTKAQYLEVRLPDGATLWSIMVDGLPALPERQADRIVVALKTASANQLRDVQIVYEHAIGAVGLRSQVELLAPSLWHRADRDTNSEPVPLVDLHWEAVLPTGFRLVQHDGTVTVQDMPSSPWVHVAGWLRTLTDIGGGVAVQQSMPVSLDYMPDDEFAIKSPAPSASMESSAPMADQQIDPFAAPAQPVPMPQVAPAAPVASSPSAAPVISAPAQPPGNAGGREQIAAGQSTAWALDGLRCLNIDLTPAKFGETVTFASLGIDPALRITVVNQRRWTWLGAACGLALFIVGLTRIRSGVAARLKYALAMVIGCMVIALASGWTIEMEPVIQAVMASGIALVSLTIFVELARKIRTRVRRRWNSATASVPPAHVLPTSTTATLIALALLTAWQCVCAAPTHAQDSPATPVTNLSELAALIDALPGSPSIPIPADAIVVPYDPTAGVPSAGDVKSVDGQQKLLVPYDTYVKLWNLAHPDERLTTAPPVVPYAWAAAQYSAVLTGNEALEITGSFKVELFSETGVTIPLSLAGGVLQSITVDGQPARVQLVEASPPPQPPQPDQQVQQAVEIPALAQAPSIMLLHMAGKGTKEIKLVVRMKIERRGGWRAIDGSLPAAPATGLTLRVPEAETEVRLTGMADRATHEIDKADGVIETALPADGRAAWQWRAKIAEAAVDQGLSVDAKAVFDVQEDGLRLAWQGNFEFRRGRRESFSLLVPGDYLVQKVLGSNIRGWNVQKVGDAQQLTIDLLTAVAERETLVVQLFRKHAQNGVAEAGASETINAPVIRVPDAMLQKGQLTIRRSRLLDLRSGTSSGLSRIDMPDNSQWLAEQSDASPLPLVPFQAFQYSQVPYTYQLTAQPMQSRVQVTTRTLLNLSELESSLESQLLLNITERQLYRLRISVPKNWRLQTPATPAAFEWNQSTSDNDQGDNDQTVEISFSDGVIGNVPIVLRGPLVQSLVTGADGVIPNVPLPKIVIQDVAQQSGDIVIVSDPAFAVRADQLQNCELGLLGSASSWLAAAQQPLAQLLVHYSNANIAGQLQIVRRVPQVTGYSISNIKVTDRSIEETLFFEFTIRTTGIRQISIVVPAYLAKCRVRGPLIRGQTWTPISTDADAPVRLVVELQEEVMGQYSLILENDRILSSGAQTAPIPVIETGKTEHRFVTLENSGRDELLVDTSSGLERLQRSQSQWNLLANLLGGKTNEAFVVSDQAEAPTLTFSTKDRAMVETVGARIGIAQTLMIVDENGAYRASQEYRIENRTEQFLEIELPDGAELWTVLVAGEPVKPMTAALPAGAGQRVRLPLVKTAAGDLDYPVLIKYGGRLPRPGALGTTRFPLVKTININVELSQVRLRLPARLQWWNFGGSMARVQSEDELTAGWLAFRTRQLTELTQILSKSAKLDFSRARALSNLKQLGAEVEQVQASAQGRTNEDLQRQLAYNGSAWFEAQKELAKPSEAVAGAEESNNRFQLNWRVESQQNKRSLNVANDQVANFQAVESFSKAQAGEFDAKWLAGNSLKGVEVADETAGKAEATKKMDSDSYGRISKGKNAKSEIDSPQPAKPNAPQLPQLDAMTIKQQPAPEAKSEDRAAQVFRYQQQLEGRSLNRGSVAQSTPAIQSGPMMGGYGMPMNSAYANAAGQPQLPPGTPPMTNDPFGAPPRGMPNRGDMSNAFGGAMGEGSGGFGGGGMGGGMQAPFGMAQPGGQMADQSGQQAGGQVSQPSYLVSLDTQLPVRGDEYLFTTPRGASEITAQSISTDTLERWSTIGALLLFGLIAWGVTHRLSKVTVRRSLRIALAIAIGLVGLMWLGSGYTPVFGIMIIVLAAHWSMS